MFEILTSGQKLKKLRKELGLTQAQLASGTISREFISMVENDVRNLSADVSLSLMKRMQKEATKKGILFSYEDDYLSISSKEELTRIVNNLGIQQINTTALKKLYDQAIELESLESQGRLLQLLAGKYYQKNFDLSFFYSSKAKEIFIKTKNHREVVITDNNLGALCMAHEKYNEATRYLMMALNYAEYEIPEAEKLSVIHNLALLFIRLKKFGDCLALLDKTQEQYLFRDKTDRSVILLVLRAIALSETGYNVEALELIEKLENLNDLHANTLNYIHSNKVYILRTMDIDQAIVAQSRLLDTLLDQDVLPENLVLLGDLFSEKGDHALSLSYHQEALKKMDPATPLVTLLNAHKKIIQDLVHLNQLRKEDLLEMIVFCNENGFKEALLDTSILFLSLSENLTDDDSQIVGILNTVFRS